MTEVVYYTHNSECDREDGQYNTPFKSFKSALTYVQNKYKQTYLYLNSDEITTEFVKNNGSEEVEAIIIQKDMGHKFCSWSLKKAPINI